MRNRAVHALAAARSLPWLVSQPCENRQETFQPEDISYSDAATNDIMTHTILGGAFGKVSLRIKTTTETTFSALS